MKYFIGMAMHNKIRNDVPSDNAIILNALIGLIGVNLSLLFAMGGVWSRYCHGLVRLESMRRDTHKARSAPNSRMLAEACRMVAQKPRRVSVALRAP
jgi:hypothetical protein